MGTYILSFLGACFILSCFFGKNKKGKAYQILFIAGMVAIIPTTIMNGRANNNVQRTKVITKTAKLDFHFQKDTLSGDSIKAFFFSDGEDIQVCDLEGNFKTKDLEKVSIYFIETDSLNPARYELTKDVVVSDSWWYSGLGIPAINRHMNVYLPKENEQLFKKTLHEKRKENNAG